jgi:Na+/melibiose symporter-like transporter
MLASVLPLALCFIAMFSPPDGVLHSQALLFSWLLGSVIALRTALTFFMVPYLALGAELSDDYHERTRLAGVRTNLGWFVGVLVPSTSLILIFQESQGTDGRFIVDNYHSYGLLSAVGVALFSAICIRGTWGHISQLGGPKEPVDSNLVRDILTTFRNANFRFLVILDTAIGGVAGIIGALLMVTYTYFWQLDTAEISLLFAGPPLIAVLLVTSSASAVNRLLEKQQLLRLSCIVTAVTGISQLRDSRDLRYPAHSVKSRPAGRRGGRAGPGQRPATGRRDVRSGFFCGEVCQWFRLPGSRSLPRPDWPGKPHASGRGA